MKGIKSLTKAEEQVMQVLWHLERGFLKEVVDAMPQPKPHANTVATLLKILVEKGFVHFQTVGRNNCYSPAVSKEEYSRFSIGNVVANYFEGSYLNAISFLVDQEQLSVDDLELLLKTLKK